MSGNERLRAAITQAGIDSDTLGELVGVDTKTIERWIAGRVPHRRNRIAVARALNSTPSEIWSDQDPTPPQSEPASEPAGEELIATYLGARDPQLRDLHQLLDQATDRIDILGLSLSELIDADTTRQLLARAEAGVKIRMLLADPESVHVLTEHAERSPDASLGTLPPGVWEIERTLGYLQPLLVHAHAEVRLFTAARPNAILRADDQMLVALHLFTATSEHEPILHLERRHERGLFDRFAHHLDLVWRHATTPVPADSALYPDPDSDPARYHPDPPGSTSLRPHAFGMVYETSEEITAAATPSTAPRSSRKRRR